MANGFVTRSETSTPQTSQVSRGFISRQQETKTEVQEVQKEEQVQQTKKVDEKKIEELSQRQRELKKELDSIDYRNPKYRGSASNRRRQAAQDKQVLQREIDNLRQQKFRLRKGYFKKETGDRGAVITDRQQTSKELSKDGGIELTERTRKKILAQSQTEREREEKLDKEKEVFITTKTKIERPDTQRERDIQKGREQLKPAAPAPTIMDKIEDTYFKARQEREYLAGQIRAKQQERERIGKERLETGDRSLISKDVKLMREIGTLKERQLVIAAKETGTELIVLGRDIKQEVSKKDFWKGLGTSYLNLGKQIKEEGYFKTTTRVGKAGALAVGGIAKQEFKEFKQDPTGKATKELILLGGTELAIKGVVKTAQLSKGIYIRAGSKFDDPALTFSRQVLEEGKTLPVSRSVKESVKSFDDAGRKVVTAAPERLTDDVAGVGKKAGLGLEDPGIYVTPKGEGSPYFLRLGDDVPTEYKYTLNPFKDITKSPTITEFETTGVTRLPRGVIKQAGFEDVARYQEDVLAGTGKVQITKRSEIGLGEVKAQTFKTKSGKLVREAGTSELEAVIPKGQEFFYPKSSSVSGRIKGFERYTTYKGQPVIIREAKLIQTKSGIKGVTFGDDFVPLTELKGTTTSKISSGVSDVKYSSPTPSIVSGAISSVTYSKSLPTSSTLSSTSKVSENIYVTRRYPVSRVSGTSSFTSTSSATSRGTSGRSTSSTTSISRGTSGGSSGSGSSRTSTSTTFKPIAPPPKTRFTFDVPEEDKKKKKKKKSQSFKPLTKYAPTLFSVVGGIKAKGKVKTKGLTGLGVRPIGVKQ